MGNSIHDRDPFLKDRCRRLYKAIYFFFNQALILVFHHDYLNEIHECATECGDLV